MSRAQEYNGKYHLAYGTDHIFGLFIQVWEVRVDGEDNFLIDRDRDHNPDLTVKEIVAIAEEYGFDISRELTNETIV